MFESLGKQKTEKKSVTLRVDQVRWIRRKAGSDATFSAVLQGVLDVVIKLDKEGGV